MAKRDDRYEDATSFDGQSDDEQSPLDFEQSLARLEEIVRKLERGDVKLADALLMYEEGVRLSAHCTKLLDSVEQKVTMLVEQADGTMKRVPME